VLCMCAFALVLFFCVLCARLCVVLVTNVRRRVGRYVCVGNQQPTGCLCMYVCVRLGAYALASVGNQRVCVGNQQPGVRL